MVRDLKARRKTKEGIKEEYGGKIFGRSEKPKNC